MYNLSLIDYCVLEEIRVLSHDNNKYGGWCIKSKKHIAESLDLGSKTIFRALTTLEEKNLIERSEAGHLRCKDEWLEITKTRDFEAFSAGGVVSLKLQKNPSDPHCVKMTHPLCQNDSPTYVKMTHKKNIQNNSKNKTPISPKGDCAIIINHLNIITGRGYKNTQAHAGYIKARLKEGYQLDDFKKVIEIKHKKWKGTEWEYCLRPSTLFGTKFDSYLNEVPQQKTNKYIDLIA